jgi:hypothetical protein
LGKDDNRLCFVDTREGRQARAWRPGWRSMRWMGTQPTEKVQESFSTRPSAPR